MLHLPQELINLIFEFDGTKRSNFDKILNSLTDVFKKYHERIEYENKGFSSEEDYDYEMSIIPSILTLKRDSKNAFVNNETIITNEYKKKYDSDHKYLLWEFDEKCIQMEDELNDYLDDLPYSSLLVSWIKNNCLSLH